MSDIVNKTPGVPIISKTARELDRLNNMKSSINCVNRVYRKLKEIERQKSLKETEVKAEDPIITAEQIRKEMDREMID